mgnify:CR=1 FL=1
MTIKINNLIKFYILFLLVKKSTYGYEIITELREKLDRKISANQVYPFLNLLKRNKLLIIKQKDEREKKIYTLTKKGRIFAIETINRFGELIEITMQPNLSVCVHCGCKIYKDYHKEKTKGKSMIFCCKHCAEAYKKYMLK